MCDILGGLVCVLISAFLTCACIAVVFAVVWFAFVSDTNSTWRQ